MVSIILKPGRDKAVKNGHPWIFSGAIERVDGTATPGEPCRIINSAGIPLGAGYYNSQSAISVRMFGLNISEFTANDLLQRLQRAISSRKNLLDDQSDSCRLINSEGDFLPGLIVDKYGQGLCIQIVTQGMERFRADIVRGLQDLLKPKFIYERSDADLMEREGLQQKNQLLCGEVPDQLIIREHGLQYEVDLSQGQKSGFFLDQRYNRLHLRSLIQGPVWCDCFCYSGGFSLNALNGGASRVLSVDQSKPAIEMAKRNRQKNGFSALNDDCICADIFTFMRQTSLEFNGIILDPPKFAKRQSDVIKASRGYKDINLIAMKKLLPGGILMTFSCSQAIDRKLFGQIVFSAAADSGRQVQLLHTLSAGPDHPVNISHREGEYLKGLVLRVV